MPAHRSFNGGGLRETPAPPKALLPLYELIKPASRDRWVAGSRYAQLEESVFDALDKLKQTRPDAVAASLEGLDCERCWRLRTELSTIFPSLVAKSLTGLDDERAWALRSRLADAAPAQVATSLLGLGSKRAHDMRGKLLKTAGYDTIRSLTGLDDERAWEFRLESKGVEPGACAVSLIGLNDSRGGALRDELFEAVPWDVARSLMCIDDKPARRMRERISQQITEFEEKKQREGVVSGDAIEWEGSYVLSAAYDELARSYTGIRTSNSFDDRFDLLHTLGSLVAGSVARSTLGLIDDVSWAIRDIAADDGHCRAVAHSLFALEDRKAHKLRAGLLDKAPLEVARSLYGLNGSRDWRIRQRLFRGCQDTDPKVLTALLNKRPLNVLEI